MIQYFPIITGSLTVSDSIYLGSGSIIISEASGSLNIPGSIILPLVSQSLEFMDDDAAAAGGVPLGGLYRNGNFLLIRIGGTESLFSDTIYWGEDSSTACAQTLPLVVTGDGTTFCNSSNFTGSELGNLGTGGAYFSYGGQLKTVNVTSGSSIATFNGGCDPC